MIKLNNIIALALWSEFRVSCVKQIFIFLSLYSFKLLCSSSKSSLGSTSFPACRVSSFTDLLRGKEGGKSSLRLAKSEGNISSHDILVKTCTTQELLCIYEHQDELHSDETVSIYTGNGSSIDWSIHSFIHSCFYFVCFHFHFLTLLFK